MTTILVTGARGFVGTILCNDLIQRNYHVRGAVRVDDTTSESTSIKYFQTGDIGTYSDWDAALANCDAVVHLAARAHILVDESRDSLAEYRRANVLATEALGRAAARQGIKRFVYVSSIGVNGRKSPQTGFSERDQPHPHDLYSQTKWEAEQILHQISEDTGLEIVIVRPPLVYGPGVPANFRRLLRLADRAVPMPLAGINNRRSFIGVRNLSDILIRCIEHPAASRETFLVSDGEDISTADLWRRLAAALGRPARLFPFPQGLLYLALRILHRERLFDQLFSSLLIDSQKARSLLSWAPPQSLEDGLVETVRWYVSEVRQSGQ